MDEDKYVGLIVEKGKIKVASERNVKDKIRVTTKSIIDKCSKKIRDRLATHDFLTNSNPKEKVDFTLMTGDIIFYCSKDLAELILLHQKLCERQTEQRSALYVEKRNALEAKLERELSAVEGKECSPNKVKHITDEISKIEEKISKIEMDELRLLRAKLISMSSKWHFEDFANVSIKQITNYKGSYYQKNAEDIASFDYDPTFGGFISLKKYVELLKEKGYAEGMFYTDESISNPLVFMANKVINFDDSDFGFAELHTKRASYGKVKALKELKDKKASN